MLTPFIGAVGRQLGGDDADLIIMRQIIQGRHDGPAVHLSLVDLLGAVIQASSITKPDGIGCGKETEAWIRVDHPVGIQKGQLAIDFQNPLDNKHHIGTASVIFVKYNGNRILQGPGQNTFAEFRNLLAITQHNGVLADQVDSADMAVQVDPDAGPVEPRCHLFDVGGFASAVIALDHHPAVMAKAGENRQRGVMVELIGFVNSGHIVRSFREGRHRHIDIKAEHAADIDCGIGFG